MFGIASPGRPSLIARDILPLGIIKVTMILIFISQRGLWYFLSHQLCLLCTSKSKRLLLHKTTLFYKQNNEIPLTHTHSMKMRKGITQLYVK